MKIRVGIFFGGPSREREISFAGGRTVYDNLNQSLFTPVPIFVDSHRNWVLLDWEYVYKGSIRDFYPPVAALPDSVNNFQIYGESLGTSSQDDQVKMLEAIGQPIAPEAISEHIDVAFLALHGIYGEDGELQRQLEELQIPYTGSGVQASEIGMDKALQKELMQQKGFACPEVQKLTRSEWLTADVYQLYAQASQTIGFPLVIRPANQGSSIGVSIIEEKAGLEGFEMAVNRAFFRELIPLEEWHDRSDYDRVEYVKVLADIRDGLGFPLEAKLGSTTQTIYHPEDLLHFLNTQTAEAEHLSQLFVLEAEQTEATVILESFISGKEFSCIVLRTEDGSVTALPPTEIIKGGEVFDYRSKYMPGLSRKETPIDLPTEAVEAIRRECEHLFNKLGFQVYARIDGFYTPESTIYLNDPNTTSGMLPSSFFFHQAAEIGLNPSQFLSLIIRISLQERLADQPEQEQWRQLLQQLDQNISALQASENQKKRIAVILGGYSFERHISVESGRNIFEKLASSIEFEPVPVFLTGSDRKHQLYQLPINLLLKDNADDIKDKILSWKKHPLLEQIRKEFSALTNKYASANVVFAPEQLTYDSLAQKVDGVFIALHGRPGEDGQIQMELEARQLPYNGSGIKSSSITIDKYRTLRLLSKHNLPVANQLLLPKEDYEVNSTRFCERVEKTFGYPLVAKPVDDGCSSAVKVIRDRQQLEAYTQLIFQLNPEQENEQRRQLKLKAKEEFSHKTEILFEQLVEKDAGIHFLEITGGMLTHREDNGKIRYEIFEPSETLASGEVLSLEEKFLAGEGQNLTPARLAVANFSYQQVLEQVQRTLERVARLLDVEGYCRIDAFVRILEDGKVETQVIEVNSLPGMTPATAIFHQAALAGYKPAAFIKKILEYGFGKYETETEPLVVAQAPPPPVEVQPEPLAPSPPPPAPLQFAKETPKKTMTEQPSETTQKPQWWRRALDFLQTGFFLRNLAAMLGLLVICFLLLNVFLSLYTSHGSSVQVENYEGMSIENATQKARNRGFSVSMSEAPYDMSSTIGLVIDQEPEALERIKKNRTIYLTTIGQPREVPISSFEDANDELSRYRRLLNNLQVKASVRETVFDAKLGDSTILHFFYQGRKYLPSDVRRGVKVLQGSTLEFVVSKSKDDYVRTPALRCKQLSEVRFLLPGLDLRLGETIGDVAIPADAYVYRQEPAYKPGGKILRGSEIKVYLQSEVPSGCATEVEINAPPSDSGGLPPEKDLTAPVDTTGGF
ncbi:MAG: PASTA domain-containing protein [Bacteroidota bacterium]